MTEENLERLLCPLTRGTCVEDNCAWYVVEDDVPADGTEGCAVKILAAEQAWGNFIHGGD